jgi:hypothetical protein
MAQKKKPYRRPVNALALYIGKVAIAANDVQFALLYIFTPLIGNRALAHSLYFSAPSDRAQQKMVREAVETVLRPIDDALATKIVKQLNQLDKYVQRRNDVIHSLWSTDPATEALTPLQPKSTLRGKNLKLEMLDLTNKLMVEASTLLMLRTDMMNLPHFRRQELGNALIAR